MEQYRFVEVFTTNATSRTDALVIKGLLTSFLEGAYVTIDLEDVDNVLRVASYTTLDADTIVRLVGSLGYEAEVMPDVILVDS